MAVYVDPLMNHGWRLGRSCHLFADTLGELRTMADMIGMKRKWEQPPTERRAFAHYDLTASRRVEAVRLGAVELNRAEAVAKYAVLARYQPQHRAGADPAKEE